MNNNCDEKKLKLLISIQKGTIDELLDMVDDLEKEVKRLKMKVNSYNILNKSNMN